MLNPIVTALAEVVVGLDSSYGRLSVVALLSPGGRKPAEYVTLETALASGQFQVTELADGAQVPELTVINHGKAPVLLLDGEELVGAKQNRIVNLTILVPAMAEVVIPVSCVEAGRWHRRSDRFSSSGNTQYARARAHKVSQVSQSLESIGEARSDQRWIWADIEAKSSRLAAGSDTAAMSTMFETHRGSVNEYLKAFPRIPGQVGALFSIDEIPAGLDLFEDEKTLASLFPKLLRSYALDALDLPVGQTPTLCGQDQRRAAEVFISAIAAAAVNAKRFPTVGLGESVRVESGGLVAAALAVNQSLVHLAAFDLTTQR